MERWVTDVDVAVFPTGALPVEVAEYVYRTADDTVAAGNTSAGPHPAILGVLH